MKLGELCQGIGSLSADEAGDLEITHITNDSRKVQHGSVFVAIEGEERDGHDYIGAASQLGAVCVMTTTPDRVPCDIPILKVEETRQAMARFARRLYGVPDRRLKVIGVTGTNGKTTFTYLVASLLDPIGKAGRIGTLSYFNGVSEERATRTTPESADVFRCLGEMVSNQCRYAALEVSSHGLIFERVRDLELRYAVFTNLSQDHLDFHGNMEAYFQAKHKQFDLLVAGGTAVINWDDSWGRRIQVPQRAGVIRFGTSPEADLCFEVISLNIKGATFDVTHGGEKVRFTIPLIGRHNIYNYAAALCVALLEGRSLEEMAAEAAQIRPVPGRMEMVDLGQPFGVIIDFAHTPDALEKVLIASRETKPRRLITVFGAGGDRDKSKRAQMGSVVDRYADMIILTSDNPRHESPDDIMDMVQQGIVRQPGDHFIRNWDRREAIRTALTLAQAGDLVLLAGKGHETTQEIRGIHHPFSDRTITENFIKASRE